MFERNEFDLDLAIEDIDAVIQGTNMEPLCNLMPSNINCTAPLDIKSDQSTGPFIRILEQPAPRALRFRYECEGRSAGSIPGINSSAQTKTHPSIQIVNYQGTAVVVVSCVTKDGPQYKPHPHNLVGREGCKKGVCTMMINSPDMICSFTSLGIQCVKKKDIEDSLRQRESIKVDPFKTGFSHRNQTSNIDLNVVRLCFQVFLQGTDKDKYNLPLHPIVSEPIYDKKALSDLIITKLSHFSSPVSGGTEVILLCDRITKDDVQILFYQEQQGQIIWKGYGDFQSSDVHKQFAISFRTPPYCNQNITQPVMVNVQLTRISDSNTSEPRPFQYVPLVDPEGLRHKRQKINEGCLDVFLKDGVQTTSGAEGIRIPRMVKQPYRSKVKMEPGFGFTSMPKPFNTSKLSNYIQTFPVNPGTFPSAQPIQEIASANSSSVHMNSVNWSDKLDMQTSLQETVDKFDSLDLGLDLKDLSEGLNLSASIFDSGNLINCNNENRQTNSQENGLSNDENLEISRLNL